MSIALVLLFLVVPLLVAPVVIAIVARRGPSIPPGLRTSELLVHGQLARAELLSWKDKGPSFLDRRPMVAFEVTLRPNEPGADGALRMTVTQSVPRALLRQLSPGMTLDVRLSPDRSTGAIVFDLGRQDR